MKAINAFTAQPVQHSQAYTAQIQSYVREYVEALPSYVELPSSIEQMYKAAKNHLLTFEALSGCKESVDGCCELTIKVKFFNENLTLKAHRKSSSLLEEVRFSQWSAEIDGVMDSNSDVGFKELFYIGLLEIFSYSYFDIVN